LRVERLEFIEGVPHYLARWRAAYLCGVLYQRAVNASALLAWARQRILLQAAIHRAPIEHCSVAAVD